ncbi:MAG: hypothetical protein IJZ59_03820 [Alphaproteobacteria bacterium]|nr:hypothetical protein [Alphaproteobacteria bacterium]
MKKFRSEQSGRSMVEMLGVLAIIGVLSVGGIAGYSKAMAKFKLSKAMDQVSNVVTNVRTLYSGQPNYSGLDTPIAIQMGAVGAEMLNGAKTTSASVAYNAFNGKVFVKAGTSGQSFFVTFTGLGKEACVALSTADWGSGSGSGLVSVSVAGTAATAAATAALATKGLTSDATLPLALSSAAGGCNGVGDTNTVVWEYY